MLQRLVALDWIWKQLVHAFGFSRKFSPTKIWMTLRRKKEWMLHSHTFLKVAITKLCQSLRVSARLQSVSEQFTSNLLNTGGNCLLLANEDGIYTVSGDRGGVLLFPE